MTVGISSSIYPTLRGIKVNSYLLNKWVGIILSPIVINVKSTINRQFDNLFVLSNGALGVVENYTPEVALRELDAIKKMLPSLRIMASKLERHNYFGDAVLREKVELTLDKFYELEGELRIKAHANKKDRQKQPRDFIEALSNKSNNTLTSVFEKK